MTSLTMQNNRTLVVQEPWQEHSNLSLIPSVIEHLPYYCITLVSHGWQLIACHSDSDISLEDARWRARVPISLSTLHIPTHIYTFYIPYTSPSNTYLHFFTFLTFHPAIVISISDDLVRVLLTLHPAIHIYTFYIPHLSPSNNNFDQQRLGTCIPHTLPSNTHLHFLHSLPFIQQ